MKGKLTAITVMLLIVSYGVNEQKQIYWPDFQLKKTALIYRRANRRIVSADKTRAGFQC